jgi:AcrR family transcriptional regulator
MAVIEDRQTWLDVDGGIKVEQARKSDAREAAESALLEAAERLLGEKGYASITTRNLAREAGLNHGLVHYYFGSVENVLVRVLERFTERLTQRQRTMFAADIPFIEKWRTAMRYLSEDASYQKVWFELQALAWNRSELREALVSVNGKWRAVLREALAEPHARYRIAMPLDALVSLVMTLNEGVMLERLSGIEAGQRELLDWIDAWMEAKEKDGRKSPGAC